MILFVALAFTCGCVAASLYRLRLVVELTSIDVSRLVGQVGEGRGARKAPTFDAIVSALAHLPDRSWERELASAVAQPAGVREGLAGEVMTDLDFRSRRWAKVPRVTASLSSTFGFLLATMALRVGLSDLVGALDDSTVLSVNSAVLDAVDVAAIGLVGAAFCVAVHARARAALTERLRDADRLVDLLERLGEGAIEPFPDPSRRASVSPPDAPGASQPRAD